MSIIINANSVDYTINTPLFGYESVLYLSLIPQKLTTSWSIWDNGAVKDWRECSCTWLMNATLTNTLIDLMANDTKGRGISVTLKLGTASGFYPFLPDHGDAGSFGVRIKSFTPKPVQEVPWLYFATDVVMVEESNPAYSLPAEVTEGDLQIGSISGLLQPQVFAKSSSNHGISTQTTRGGVNYTIDKTSNADRFETELRMGHNQSKAAALINHLAATVRDNQVEVYSGANNYLFGREKAGTAAFNCYMLNQNIKVKHSSFDLFDFSVLLGYVSDI